MSCHLQLTNHIIFFEGYPSIIGFCFGVVVIPLIFPKVPQSSLGIPRGFPTVRNTPSPWTPPGPFKNPTNLCEICRLTTTFLAPWPWFPWFDSMVELLRLVSPYQPLHAPTEVQLQWLSQDYCTFPCCGRSERWRVREKMWEEKHTHTHMHNEQGNKWRKRHKMVMFFFFFWGKFENNGGSILKRGNSKLPSW